jgi:hypothetical protein
MGPFEVMSSNVTLRPTKFKLRQKRFIVSIELVVGRRKGEESKLQEGAKTRHGKDIT